MGRRTLALAILGVGVTACSSSDDSTDSATTPDPTTGPTATTPPETTTAETGTGADDAVPEAPTAPSLDWAQVAVGNVSAYVLVRGNEAAIVDTGNPGSEDEIGAALQTLGAHYGDVNHVVLTHHHPDHIGSLAGVLAEAPTATAYAGQADIENIISPNPLQAVGDGDDIFGLLVIETPGHTPGSISVLDSGIGLLIAGDALNTNDGGTEVLGPNASFTADMTTAIDSVAKLGTRRFETVAVGHGNPVEGGAADLVAQLATQL